MPVSVLVLRLFFVMQTLTRVDVHVQMLVLVPVPVPKLDQEQVPALEQA